VIRTRRVPFFYGRPSRPLLVATLAVVLTGFLIPYTPLAGAPGFRPLPWTFLAILVGMAATYLGVAEAGKAYFFYRLRRGQAAG
jgi:P-type Mg2+ transporter